ncbi:MAG: hypothetical protein GEU28_14860 [Dehalococcoidia bacterium]|nr:hypothetical protein [Dehalococcoidia bacterium]MPZ31642.1 hypothetical protein [Rhodospirillales bacterium]
MSEGIPTSRVALVDTIGLRIQELHASGKLAGDQPLLRIDNSERARQAPFQFDAARGQLHRTGCRAIPPTSRSALYGVWEIGTDGAAVACPRCNPMGKPAAAEPEATPQQKAKQTEEAKQDESAQPEAKQGEAKAEAVGGRPQDDQAVDILYGVLSIVSQFGSVLRERGQEYRKSGAGAALGDRIEKIYAEVNESERSVLDVLTTSLGTLAAALREIEGGLNSERTRGAGPRGAEPSAARPRQDEAQ